MASHETASISPALAGDIEDAIMFGRPGDLEAIVDNIGDDGGFPADLRYGLESLNYFRAHYGQQPALDETGKKKIALMDQSWSAELLNKIRTRIDTVVKRA